jgi:hypothetical protein
MNKRLLNAIQALETTLGTSQGESMDELMHKLLISEDFGEAELRAAVWTLVSDGVAEVENGKVHLATIPVAA